MKAGPYDTTGDDCVFLATAVASFQAFQNLKILPFQSTLFGVFGVATSLAWIRLGMKPGDKLTTGACRMVLLRTHVGNGKLCDGGKILLRMACAFPTKKQGHLA